jgi:ABC-type dipeptide/oligopeptide/nickel transport system ATPase component
MCCVPRLDKKWVEDEANVELKAKQSNLTAGCVYYARCPFTDKYGDCAGTKPTLVETEPDHFVACFRYGFADF